jgi:hypothetical protein
MSANRGSRSGYDAGGRMPNTRRVKTGDSSRASGQAQSGYNKGTIRGDIRCPIDINKCPPTLFDIKQSHQNAALSPAHLFRSRRNFPAQKRCIFCTDFFTDESKNTPILTNAAQRKLLKNKQKTLIGLDPESGVLPIGRSPSRGRKRSS